MKITVREKSIKHNRKSLYLDFYPAILNPNTGKYTRREFLGLYIYAKPKTDLEKAHNKNTKLLAQNIAAKRQLEVQEKDYGFFKKKIKDEDLLPFFKSLADNYKNKSSGDTNNWPAVYRYLYDFTGGVCMKRDITIKFCERFKDYIQTAKPSFSTKTILANNSAVLYFSIFRKMVKIAYEAEKLDTDVAKDISNIKRVETQREYLTYEELKILAKTPCDLPVLKNAALFSALTGLRYSDIAKLTWQEIYMDDTGNLSIRFTQKKTKGVQSNPISGYAANLLGKRGLPNEKVFKPLLYSSWQNMKIQEWVYRAGIYRKITFHCFRHSFATVQLSLGTDIMTIKEMLGHKSVQTTLIYAKVVSSTKREAADKMNLD